MYSHAFSCILMHSHVFSCILMCSDCSQQRQNGAVEDTTEAGHQSVQTSYGLAHVWKQTYLRRHPGISRHHHLRYELTAISFLLSVLLPPNPQFNSMIVRAHYLRNEEMLYLRSVSIFQEAPVFPRRLLYFPADSCISQQTPVFPSRLLYFPGDSCILGAKI